ncbi:hypothetical protein C405_20999 [Stenotrophomonas maltophilia AU12-09]|uniref:hypothetical protein n=1 Tax=Stenotrophomonas maltophilia TaxID=40324 RepID=UPI0002BF3423|nr:hypothetical protein [Stenotrophomonas maltophilia]EMI47528.1 hypothetical protein C405_20999 [Stenotrophomonas maltophilia AU12-09]
MNRSDNESEPKVTDTAPGRHGNGWGGVAAIVLAFAILHLWLGFTTDKLGYFIGGTCLLVITGILLTAQRTRAVSQRPVETPTKGAD